MRERIIKLEQLCADKFLENVFWVHRSSLRWDWEDGLGGKVLVVKVYELLLKIYDLSLDPQHPCMSQLFTIGIVVVHMNACG